MAIKSYVDNDSDNDKPRTTYEVYVQGRDARGKRVQKRKRGIESLKKAQEIEFQFKREIAVLKEENRPYTWAEWHEECISRMKMQLASKTIEGYQLQLSKWVTPNWRNRDIKEISKKDVFELIYGPSLESVSPYTRRNILKMTNRIFTLAVEEGAIHRNPCIGLKVRVGEVEQQVLTNHEVETFLLEAKKLNHRFFAVWFLALKTGMRSGELMALEWSDVDFETRTIRVSKQWSSKAGFGPTKTQKSRVVPISEDLLTYLREERLKRVDSDFILPRLTEWLRGEQAQVTREFCKSIGITDVKFHDLRATFITNLLARGVPLAQVMAVVGHSQLKTTNGYLRKAGVEVKGVTDRLGYNMPELGEAKLILLKGKPF